MTIAELRRALTELDLTLRVTDGEYRVNFRGGPEATAYYTNDRDDALTTGIAMERVRRVTIQQCYENQTVMAQRRGKPPVTQHCPRCGQECLPSGECHCGATPIKRR